MRAVLVSEWRKVTSTGLWWILAVGIGLYMAFMGGLLGFTFGIPAEEGGMGGAVDDLTGALAVYGVAASVGYVFPLVLGALSITGEFRHRTITPTFLAEPRRWRVLVAKLGVQGGFGALYGVVGTAAAVAAGAVGLSLSDTPTMLGEPEVWGALARTVLVLALWGMIGVGFGSLVPNQVASVVTILAFTQLVEPLLRMGLSAWDVTSGVAAYLPGAASDALVGASIYSMAGGGDLLPTWAGGLVLAGYAVLFAAIGAATTLRRDVS